MKDIIEGRRAEKKSGGTFVCVCVGRVSRKEGRNKGRQEGRRAEKKSGEGGLPPPKSSEQR